MTPCLLSDNLRGSVKTTPILEPEMTTDPRTLDPKNLDMLRTRLAEREKITGPRVGDWIVRLDGTRSRATYVWDLGGEDAHVQDGGSEGAAFYLLSSGHESYSGGLNPGIPTSSLQLTEETQEGWVWFFHRDHWMRDNAVSFPIQERVWKQVV